MKNLFLALVVSMQLFAGDIEFKGEAKSVKISGTEVKVFPEAVLKTGDKELKVKLTGHATRVKDIPILGKRNVYQIASYMDDLSNVNPEKPLDSLKDTKARVLQLTMLMSMTGGQMRGSLEDSLKANEVDITTTAFKDLFAKFKFSLDAGDTATIMMFTKEGNVEKVLIEVNNSNPIAFSQEAKFLGFDLWKAWFGAKFVKGDDGVKNLQPKLLEIKK